MGLLVSGPMGCSPFNNPGWGCSLFPCSRCRQLCIKWSRTQVQSFNNNFSPSGSSTVSAEMLPCLQRVLRPALYLRAGTGLGKAGLGNPPAAAGAPMVVQRCDLGTHPLKEPMEPLNSPRGAKEFIYSLHPSERSCLLRELHRFESIAIAQGTFILRNYFFLLLIRFFRIVTEIIHW